MMKTEFSHRTSYNRVAQEDIYPTGNFFYFLKSKADRIARDLMCGLQKRALWLFFLLTNAWGENVVRRVQNIMDSPRKVN